MEGTLSLANGKEYTGHWHGELTECYGEIIFYTGMVNFMEFLTDPAVKNKLIVATFPGILNSYIDTEKYESGDLQLAGLITQQEKIIPVDPHHSLMNLLKEKAIPVMTGMDTRSIMKQVMKSGEMPAIMKAKAENKINTSQSKEKVIPKNQIIHSNGKKHVVVIDFGLKKSFVQWLQTLNYKLTVVSGKCTAENIKSFNPDGIIFSGGAGNPVDWKKYYKEYTEIAKTYPTMAFGLGHQILALSFGATVEKMKCGHRSFKQAIIDASTKLVYMSNQNHGYVVKSDRLADSGWRASFLSVQDGSIEGLIHEQYPITTYQFHPDGKNKQLEVVIHESFSHHLTENKGEKLYAQA